MRAFTGIISLIGILAFTGCAHNTNRHVPFSEDWTHHERGERAFNERRQRIGVGREAVLAGEEGQTRAAVVVDERGRPNLNLGRAEGLSADVQIGSGTGAFLKYKRGWNHTRPERRGTSRR